MRAGSASGDGTVAGLTVHSFRGLPHVQEVRCSGHSLPSDTDLFSMLVFDAGQQSVLAVANLKKRECSTSQTFTSCDLGHEDSKQDALRVLVVDLKEGETRMYGCNLSVLAEGGRRFEVLSWSVVVHFVSEYPHPQSSTACLVFFF